MRDGSREPAYRCQSVLNPDFAFQAADLGEVVKGIDKAEVTAHAHVERGNQHAKSLAETVDGRVADFGIAPSVEEETSPAAVAVAEPPAEDEAVEQAEEAPKPKRGRRSKKEDAE